MLLAAMPSLRPRSPGVAAYPRLPAFTEFTFAAGTLSAGVPTAGTMIEFDDANGTGSERAAGAFYLQNASDFVLSSITGP
jgi:hypothetical protein